VRRLTLACCLLACAALAAPVPKPKDSSGFKAPEWGLPIDPAKDCTFTFAGERVYRARTRDDEATGVDGPGSRTSRA